MAIIGQLTLDQVSILEVDADPSGTATAAPIGSIATLYDGVNGRLWIKTAAANTSWSLIPRLLNGTPYAQGIVPYADANGILISDITKLRFDATNGRLGIGTAAVTPVSAIHIDNGTATASGIRFTAGTTTGQTATDGFSVGIGADGQAYIYNWEGANLNFGTNNLVYMTLAPTGALSLTKGTGLMTITPGWFAGGTTGTWINLDTTGPSGIGSGGAGANAWIAYAQGNGNWFNNALAGDIAYRNTTGRILIGTNATTSTLLLDAAGNVGIGNITPTRQLDISGTMRIRGGSPSIGKVLQTQDTTGDADWIDTSDINHQSTFADEFIHDVQAGVLVGIGWILVANAGTVTSPTTNVDANHPGIVQLTATAVNQQPLIYLNSNSNIVGNGTSKYQMLVKTPAALPTAGENYVFRAGTGDNIAANATDYQNGMYFEFPVSGTTQIQCKTAAANTRTTTSSGVVWAVNTWYLLEMTLITGSVIFSINGTVVATNTTNIPTGATNYYGPIFKLMKTNGSAVDPSFYIDAFRWTKFYAGNRY